MTTKVTKKLNRIAVLIALLVIAGLGWYIKFQQDRVGTPEAAPAKSEGGGIALQPLNGGFGFSLDRSAPKAEGPAPDTFSIFEFRTSGSAPSAAPSSTENSSTIVFTESSTLLVKGTCADALYAILIFPVSVDYRSDPAAAVYNSADACPEDKIVERAITLSSLRLQPGTYYYFFADQSARGGWYNPR